MQLASKTALVTGAANRLGAETARTLHQNGANLIIHYRSSRTAAQKLIDELNAKRSHSAIAVSADLTDSVEIDALAESACNAFSRLDLLVNNASGFYPTPLETVTGESIEDLFSTNFKAPLLLAKACYPSLKKAQGSIINLIDIYASKPLLNHSVYCSAKAANQMLVKTLALELAPEVRVNGIAPGAILWPEGDHDAAKQQAILDQIPMARSGSPQAIAATVVFLACNDYITGEIIRVDGGRLLK
ncbi:MAG: pteridine reductase [Pseudomonadota bacterium]